MPEVETDRTSGMSRDVKNVVVADNAVSSTKATGCADIGQECPLNLGSAAR